MKQITILALTLFLTAPFLSSAQEASNDLAMATLSEKMDKLGAEMDNLGKIMESKGAQMEKYGKEMEKSHGDAPEAEKQMEELGESMNELGEQMGKLGEQMGQYGEKMGQIHQDMIDWFFHELKNDGLITTLEGKSRVIFDEQGLDVNGAKASDAQYKKYKSGLEKYWGKSLKADFLLFFKGTIKEKGGKIETDGDMNTDF